MSLAPEQLQELNGKLVYAKLHEAGKEAWVFARIYYLPDAVEAILDYAFTLDPREKYVAIKHIVSAEAMRDDIGTDSRQAARVSPHAAWELFRAIIAAATVTQGCSVSRVRYNGAVLRQDAVQIRTPGGNHGLLSFDRPANAQDRSRVTWEGDSSLYEVSSLTTGAAIKAVLYIDPLDRPSIWSSDAFTPPM
jgi:hypothetical protein